MVRIPYGTKYTTRISGVAWKPIVCEYCGCEYLYRIKHQTTGSSTNVLWLNKQKAVYDAENKAGRNLKKYLDKAVRNYACPNCGCYQEKMIQRMKKEIWLKGVVFGTIAFVLVGGVTSSFDSESSIVYGIITGIAVSMLFLSKLMSYKPNEKAETRKNRKFSENYPVLKKTELEKSYKERFLR